jgi:chromosome segregation ATPase
MFADPVNWDNERAYEPLTIVVHNGDCYTSKCFVPVGADITNGLYWVKSQDYNYQFDQLKQVVADLSKQVTAFAGDNAKFTELINNFSTEFATMQTEFNKWSVQFPTMNERIDAAEADIDALQAADAETAKTIDGLKKTDSELAGRLDGHDTDIEGLRAKDVEQDGRLDAIDAKNTQYDADIAALKAKDADQQTQLDTIKAKDTEQDTRLDGIDTKLAQNTADIDKNTKNIQDNAANIAANAQELADHAEQLKDHNARLTAQQKEITDNRTAIERNTSDIAGLRSDLTEAEANIAQNADAISHIQEKDTRQDERLDSLEQRTTTAEGRLDGLDTKTDATNTALTEEISRAKAAELANGKLIAKNAKELADHETRITALEGDNTTNKQEIADIKAKNTAQDTAISGNTDAIAHINDSLAGYVKTETYTAGQAAQDTKITAAQAAADKANASIGDWETDHPGQTISECATSQENELTEHAGSIAKLETDKADKTAIPDVSGFVTTETYDAGQAAQDERLDALESAHHYANIEEAIKGKGYLNIVESHAQFAFKPATSSAKASVTLASSVDLRIQLTPDTVIDDTTTTPTGTITVSPNFGYINKSGNYTSFPDGLLFSIMSARYYPAIHNIQMTLTQTSQPVYIDAKPDTNLLFWNFSAYYL